MAVSLTRLRGLARLYRQDVEGAKRQLIQLAGSDDIDKALGLKGPFDVECMVRAIEQSGARQRQNQIAERREVARHVAKKLAETARFNRKKGRLDLDPDLLVELASTGGYPYLGIDIGGQVKVFPRLPLLRELFKRCRGARIESLFVLGKALTAYYSTGKSRGSYRLAVEPLRKEHEDVLIVRVRGE